MTEDPFVRQGAMDPCGAMCVLYQILRRSTSGVQAPQAVSPSIHGSEARELMDAKVHEKPALIILHELIHVNSQLRDRDVEWNGNSCNRVVMYMRECAES
jgi:hypothetical protein